MAFTILIVFSAVFFFFYKIKHWRSKAPVEKRWLQTKANMALGSFLVAFGLNLLVYTRGTIDIVIGSIFTLLGLANVILGYKAYRHYLPQVIAEAEQATKNA
ncbi:YtpI family protein [Desertibacillus haloalkaliphilus]|uniref:YtpI family protein n=1 Tax=Desertibacillus haloalkaliphilus TaxID=1328930 RepID=UPI001C279DD0|nr:YtpI family protein [Desertibacillus haloalkaliphilus]MBU8905170.1 YtpI family protein [Desertibacillus haloalkaliphilus]